MHFSDLARAFTGATNRLYAVREELRSAETPVVDLVRGSVHDIGITFPDETLAEILRSAALQARVYRPDSLGQPGAREAVAGYYGSPRIVPEHCLLTPGTSVSYWYIFKLLGEPGDQILCPVPSYPLFDYIARLAGVEIRHYRLREAASWAIDLEHLEQQITHRTRAIVLVSPHNPTGAVAGRVQVEGLAAIARRHQLPVVSDEVFNEFIFGDSVPAWPRDTDAPLVFTLNGFSKMFALPGMKIGWMAVSGDEGLVGKAMATLELISDTFLPVNEVAQFAVPAVFEKGRPFLERYRDEVRSLRDATLRALGRAVAVPPEAGFYLVLPYARDIDEEDFAIELLEEEHVLVHPGYFYDIEGRHLVLSYIQNTAVLREVLSRLQLHLSVS